MNDWSWKPPYEIKPARHFKTSKKKERRNKRKKKKISRYGNDKFYSSPEWRKLRVRVLEKYDCRCMMCGRSPKLHGVVLNVDHIIPRSKRPDLALVFENLQILCGACNHGKLNRYETDYRPDTDEAIDEVNELLDKELLGKIPF